MGLRPFSKALKSPSPVLDPPVFNHKQEHGLRKAQRSHKQIDEEYGNGKGQHDPPVATSSSSSSSTALWVASANAEAKKQRQRTLSQDSSHSVASSSAYSTGEDSSYYEEVIEDFSEDEIHDVALPPRRITIRFDEYDEMQTVLHINDYTNGEISRSWYKRTDYDKMVTLARKTAEKVEERRKDISKMDSKTSRKIESRGLEAWTTFGAAKVRLLKESAVEAVWNEQSRQWDEGVHDPERLRESYLSISKGAQAAAEDRGFSDFLIAKRIREIEEEMAEKKRNRRLLGKSKDVAKKMVKKTAGGVVKTAKLGVKTTKLTGKVALKTTKVATKTAVATATLDRKMLKEAIIPKKKKEEFTPEFIRQTSKSNIMETGRDEKRQDEDNFSEADSSAAGSDGGKKKKQNLKLLGVVPIPGTTKTYREDRRLARLEKRHSKSTLPAWEQGLSRGKY